MSKKMNVILGYPEGLNDDNSATLWWMKDGAELNEPLQCPDLAKLCTSAEVLDLIRGDRVGIEESRIWAVCTKKEEQT